MEFNLGRPPLVRAIPGTQCRILRVVAKRAYTGTNGGQPTTNDASSYSHSATDAVAESWAKLAPLARLQRGQSPQPPLDVIASHHGGSARIHTRHGGGWRGGERIRVRWRDEQHQDRVKPNSTPGFAEQGGGAKERSCAGRAGACGVGRPRPSLVSPRHVVRVTNPGLVGDRFKPYGVRVPAACAWPWSWPRETAPRLQR